MRHRQGAVSYTMCVSHMIDGGYFVSLIAYPLSPEADIPNEYYTTFRCETFAEVEDHIRETDERMANRRIEIVGKMKR